MLDWRWRCGGLNRYASTPAPPSVQRQPQAPSAEESYFGFSFPWAPGSGEIFPIRSGAEQVILGCPPVPKSKGLIAGSGPTDCNFSVRFSRSLKL
jgi:hypothetical protein